MESISLAGVPGQRSNSLGAVAEAKLERALGPGDTLSHSWVKGYWRQTVIGDLSRVQMTLGIGFYTSGVDNGDFPDLARHDGDWQLHDARSLQEPIVANDPLVPRELAILDLESRGQRTIPRGGDSYRLFLVVQASQVASAGVWELHAAVTCLWLLS